MTFELAYPWIFIILPIPFLVYWLFPPLKKKKEALITPAFFLFKRITGQTPVRRAWVSKRDGWNWAALLLVWIGLVSAMSSPQLVGEPEKKVKTARSFLIAADISFSMDTRDWEVDGKQKSRWEAVKFLLKEFIKERKSDKMGLVFFGSNAYVQAPLTNDLNTISWMLDQTEVGMAGQMTGIGNAIGLSMQVFEKDTLEEKILFLLTDGVDSGSDITPTDAATLAKTDSITIYTLGIGTKAGGLGDLDEKTLQQVAEITGGAYYRVFDEKEMTAVYDIINRIKPVEYEATSFQPTVLLYSYPLGAALAIALLWMLGKSCLQMWFKTKKTKWN